MKGRFNTEYLDLLADEGKTVILVDDEYGEGVGLERKGNKIRVMWIDEEHREVIAEFDVNKEVYGLQSPQKEDSEHEG